MPAFKDVSTTWREGRYFDRWMIVHTFGGITGGFSNVIFGLSTPAVYFTGFGIMVVWEIAEYAVGIRESWENRLLDVVVGLLGVFIALAVATQLGTRGQWVALVSCGTAFGLGGLFGWIAHMKKRRAGR